MLGGFTKLTFCFLYLRIFPQKYFNRLIIAIAAIIAVGSLAFTIGTIFQCVPVQKAWNRAMPGNCTNNTGFWYSHAAFNTFMDIVVYILPIPMIRTLKLARGQKTGLISIFVSAVISYRIRLTCAGTWSVRHRCIHCTNGLSTIKCLDHGSDMGLIGCSHVDRD